MPRNPDNRNARGEEVEKRLKFIDPLINDGWSTHRIVCLVVEEFGVSERTAYGDVAEARARRAPIEQEEARTLNEIAARKWERRQYRCEQLGKESDANYALDRWCKVVGAYAPKKIEISGNVGVTVQMRAVMGVLDHAGLAALEVVLAQVEAAKSRGELPPGTPEMLDAPAEPAKPKRLRKPKE